MSIRSELEGRLLTWAAAQVPAIPVSLEGVPFTKPTSGNYLEAFFLTPATRNPTVAATRKRITGIFQVNCCVPDGKGSTAGEALADSIITLFPVVPKSLFTTVSIEQTPNKSAAIPDATWRIIPVSISYRQES